MSLSILCCETERQRRFMYRFYADQVTFPGHRSIDWDAVSKYTTPLRRVHALQELRVCSESERDIIHPQQGYLGYPDTTLSTPLPSKYRAQRLIFPLGTKV